MRDHAPAARKPAPIHAAAVEAAEATAEATVITNEPTARTAMRDHAPAARKPAPIHAAADDEAATPAEAAAEALPNTMRPVITCQAIDTPVAIALAAFHTLIAAQPAHNAAVNPRIAPATRATTAGFSPIFAARSAMTSAALVAIGNRASPSDAFAFSHSAAAIWAEPAAVSTSRAKLP